MVVFTFILFLFCLHFFSLVVELILEVSILKTIKFKYTALLFQFMMINHVMTGYTKQNRGLWNLLLIFWKDYRGLRVQVSANAPYWAAYHWLNWRGTQVPRYNWSSHRTDMIKALKVNRCRFRLHSEQYQLCCICIDVSVGVLEALYNVLKMCELNQRETVI